MAVFNNKAAEAAKLKSKETEDKSTFRKADSTKSNSVFKVADTPTTESKAKSVFVDRREEIKVTDAVETTNDVAASTGSISIEEVANDVIQGKYGNGAERKAALEKAGYNYDEVQAKVNELLKSTEDIAKEVIQGKWGNGADRKTALENAGYDYNVIQAKVNELLK